MVHHLVEDSKSHNEAATLLGMIVANAYYESKPIIDNMLGRLGPYNDVIVTDVIELTRNHIQLRRMF